MTAPDSRDSVERVVAEMRDTNTSVMLGGRADYPQNLIAEWADRLQALARGPQQAGGEDAEARNEAAALDSALNAVQELQAEVARLTSSYVELETMYRQQGLNAFALLKRAETAEVALREAREILIDVMGWIPNGGAWHTEEPMKAMERARAFLSRDAALNGGQDDA